MSNITTKQSVLLKGLSKKTVVAQFDQDHASSDGGAVLLKACCEYVVAMAKNSVLKTLAEPAMAVVREDADQDEL